MNDWKKHLGRWQWYVAIFLAISYVIAWFVVGQIKPKETVSVSFLNVGNGDAILIQGLMGNSILIDGGPDKTVLTELNRLLPLFARSLDAVVETHSALSSSAGLPFVLAHYHVGTFFNSGVAGKGGADGETEKLLSEQNIPVVTAQLGTTIDLHDGSFLRILFPDRKLSGVDPSTASIVAQYVFGKTCFLFMADAPLNIENYLVSLYGANFHCQVLKVAHQGADTSTGEEFLSAVSPEYSVISVAPDNTYGYPKKAVTDRLTAASSTIITTAEHGTITFVSDGENVWLK
jgi:competence protein ComEC